MSEDIEHELKELQKEEERHHPKEQGFFSRLFGKKQKEPSQEEIDALTANLPSEPEEPTLPEDAKEAIRTLHRWLEQLPQKRLEEFKNSEDFQHYKEVLQKYGMVRKKEAEIE
ncbi:MAG: hypothetical protein AABX70_06075 [Nanoarchaeota archaeon]